MKIKSVPVVLAFFTALLGGFQTALGALPEIGSYKPIPIPISQTRGSENLDLKPQPGYDVTLLLNQSVTFAWSNTDAKKFVIKDEKGTKIFDCDLTANKNYMAIVPSKLKLKSGQKYSWNIDGKKDYTFTILDEAIEKELWDKLAEIDAENLSAEERALKKATYLLMLSEQHADKFDFYWLIAQLMSEISPTDKELSAKKSDFLLRCSLHLDEKM